MKKNVLKKVLQPLFIVMLLLTAFISHAQIGGLDASFDPDEGADNTVRSIVPLADGKILIGGDFTDYNGTERNGIARLNADGTLDTDFDPGTGIALGVGSTTVAGVYSIVVQSDDKILISGIFSSCNGASRKGIARLNSDGSLDTSFTSPLEIIENVGGDVQIQAIALQADGKIILAGNFNITLNEIITRKGIARLNTDGSLDSTFSSYLTPYSTGYYMFFSVVVQPDGKILVGGNAASSSVLYQKLIRLNSDGTKDAAFTAFNQSASGTAVRSILLQPDNKIIIAGSFTGAIGGGIRKYIARLNATGSLDTTFDPVASTVGAQQTKSMALQADGKIILVGDFVSYNGTARKGIARINANGSLDTSFLVGTGAVATDVYAVALQADGKVLMGGIFTSYNGNTRNRIARLLVTAQTIEIASLSDQGPYCPASAFDINYTATGTFNTGNVFTAQLSDASGSFAAPVTIGTVSSLVSGTIAVVIPANVISGTAYRIRIISGNPVINGTDNGTDITINVTPAPIATSQAFCGAPTVADLDATVIEGATKNWYAGGTFGEVLETTVPLSSGSYYVSQTLNGCESPRVEITVTVTEQIIPDFAAIAPICSGSTAPILALTSPNGITGTWSPATVSNTEDATYTFTPDAEQCAAIQTLAVTITPHTVPDFAPITPICSGSTAPVLELTSPNGVTGTWSPATVSNTQDGTYVFTPTAGLCATSQILAVTITSQITPDFAEIAPVCSGSTAPVLGLMSPNGVTGTWTPATVSNTEDATYTFTPDAEQCATIQVLNVTITSQTAPDFAVIAPICSGSTAPVLELTSPNGITGTWSPATVSSTANGTYIFTPDAGQCATTQILSVTITPQTVPDFAEIAPICSGSAVPTLELVSPNGVTGTWTPAAISNTEGGNYLFTPDSGQCAAVQTLTVAVTQNPAPEGVAVQDFTTGQTLADFAVTGEGVQWYDAATGGNLLPETTLIVSGTVYFASQTIADCESINRLQITAGVNLGNTVFDMHKLRYYPNPVTDVITLEYNKTISSITVYNLLGQKVITKEPNISNTQLNMSSLPAGSYIIRISSGNEYGTIKIIKK